MLDVPYTNKFLYFTICRSKIRKKRCGQDSACPTGLGAGIDGDICTLFTYQLRRNFDAYTMSADELSEYERLRLERIARNRERMRSLGVDAALPAAIRPTNDVIATRTEVRLIRSDGE